ncbi:hypothetical protein PMAYCL1PPCAC_08488, partial [Pristionchus mayeri]
NWSEPISTFSSHSVCQLEFLVRGVISTSIPSFSYDNIMLKYSFHSCELHNNKPALVPIGKIASAGELHFAVQQPYFISPFGNFIEPFSGSRIKLHAKISGSQKYFCGKNRVYIVTKDPETVTPTATASENLIIIILPDLITLPHSVYAEDESMTYMLCGEDLLIIHENLEICVISNNFHELTNMDSLSSTISGVLNGALLLNEIRITRLIS